MYCIHYYHYCYTRCVDPPVRCGEAALGIILMSNSNDNNNDNHNDNDNNTNNYDDDNSTDSIFIIK